MLIQTKSELTPNGTVEDVGYINLLQDGYLDIDVIEKGNYVFTLSARCETTGNISIGSQSYDISNNWDRLSFVLKNVENSINIKFGKGIYYLYEAKLEIGNKATDWTPAPEDVDLSIDSVDEKAQGIIDNIYTPNTTTIDGGKITTGSITAAKINVTDLFAQDITATGTITGAKLYGTYIETVSGKISGFIINDDKLTKKGAIQEFSEDSATNNYAYYGLYSFDVEITSDTDNYADYSYPYLFCVNANNYIGDISNPTVNSTTTVFGVNGKEVYANILNIGYGINSDLLPIWKTKTATSAGYSYTYYDLGSSDSPWENLYCKNANILSVIGSASSIGYGQLTVGNSIASGTAGNARGRIGMYGTSSGYTMLYPGYAGTSSVTINLPSSAGTLALTSSDKRLKENVQDTEVSGLDFINAIKLHQFDWKESGDHWACGYIADELIEQDEHLVLEGSGGLNDDGSINPYCVDDFYISAYQTKAIQELYKRIIELEEEINILKKVN